MLGRARGILAYIFVASRKVYFPALLLAIDPRSTGFAGTDRYSIHEAPI